MKYLLGADIGTTSLKAAVFDEKGHLIRSTTKDYTLNVSGDRVELPAETYFDLFKSAYEEIANDLPIKAIAIDTQCETLILTDEQGRPLCDAVVWLDNRAKEEADQIKARFGNEKVYNVTGQAEITPTWPASKLLWFKNNKPIIFSKIRRVFLLEDYLLFRLTGQFVTEKTLQSSTIYFDINKGEWWDEMLDFIGISKDCLPTLKDSGTPIGEYKGATVVTSAMDQVAGAIGAGVVEEGTVSEMTGTAMAIFAPCKEVPPYNPKSIVPCHYNYNSYCRLAWTPTSGITLKWFRNQFSENFSFKQLDSIAKDIPAGSCGLTFLPFLCGSTMPICNPDAKGAFIGLTLEHTRAHAARAILESVACMLKENLDYLGTECNEIRSMGGGASSPLWCQIKADLTKKRIAVLETGETACLGSAILAGVGVGVFKDVKTACADIIRIKKVYEPQDVDYTECYNNYLSLEEKLL